MRLLLRPANLVKTCSRARSAVSKNLDLSQLDRTQVKLLDEVCILVDGRDRCVGAASKKDCHLVENIDKGMLHRAFSVFLFNARNELLLQKRSSAKLTYPEHWTNTCCSHPLHVTDELDEADALGVRLAARRRLEYELGVDSGSLSVDAIDYLTRIHYQAPNVPAGSPFAEHEIDYCLVVRGEHALAPNPNEVGAVRYVGMEEMRRILETETIDGERALLTPWFRLISSKFLFAWWSNLSNLAPYRDHTTIHRL